MLPLLVRHPWNMTTSYVTKTSAERSDWADFHALVDPHGTIARVILRIMIPVAVLALIYALAAVAFGGLSLASLAVVTFLMLVIATPRQSV